jgi:hypothetical protein
MIFLTTADIPVEADPLDSKIVARISQILNETSVPNLLWGQLFVNCLWGPNDN